METTIPRLSTRAFEDLWQEVSDLPLEVSGTLPEDLRGTLYRVVPTGFNWPKGSFTHWFEGHGQVHAIRLGPEGARYTNRFVETEALARSRRTGRPVRNFATVPNSLPDWLDRGFYPTANTNVLKLGDRLLALQEGSLPVALDPRSLRTLGPDDLGFLAGQGYSAHPHLDPRRGEIVAASLAYGRTGRMHVSRLDRTGGLLHRFSLDLPYAPVMVHDFGLSERHVAIPVFPQITHPIKLLLGMESLAYDSEWAPEKGAFVLMTDRDGGNLRRYELPPMYAFHVINCFDEQDTLVLDMVCFASGEIVKQIGRLPISGVDGVERGYAQRFRLHADGRVDIERLSETPMEFPRIDPRNQGQAHPHAYAVGARATEPRDLSEFFGRVVKFSLGREEYWEAPSGHIVGEAVPIAKDGHHTEVWLLSVVYDPERHLSRLVVLDGEDPSSGPVAELGLPHHMPLGFHGNFHRS